MTEYDTRSVPESENKGYYHLPASRGSPILIVFRYPFLTPQKALAPKRLFWNFPKKSNFAKKVLERS